VSQHPNAPTLQLASLGQSLWLDNITRELLRSGTLRDYVERLSVTGLTSNPTIFNQAFRAGSDYDDDLRRACEQGRNDEQAFFELALADLRRAAEIFLPVHRRTDGVDGWVSLEVSPLLAHDTRSTIAVARALHQQAGLPNLYIKIPGTSAGLPAIEDSIFAGVPVNVTLLFSRSQYLAAADAWLRGIERRIANGRSPAVSSVASLFISRWDVAVANKAPAELQMTLGIAVGEDTYRAYDQWLASPRVRRVMNAGARPQRLLFASTGTKDPKSSDTLYVEAFAAPLTVNTIPEATLKAFADHGRVDSPLSPARCTSDQILKRFTEAGIDLDALAVRLQDDGAAAFVTSWNELMRVIETKRSALTTT